LQRNPLAGITGNFDLMTNPTDRFSKQVGTRPGNNYKTEDGSYSAAKGLLHAAADTFRPEMLAMDAASFGAAGVVWGRIYGRTRGTAVFNPLLTNTITGATIGIASGGCHELMRQVSAREINPYRFFERTLTEGGFGAAGGALGGWQSARYSRINYANRPGFNSQEPRLSSFVDDLQVRLRDGKFMINNKNANLSTEAWSGKVTMPDGTSLPAIFRSNTGAPGYTELMMAEVSGYSSGQLSGIGKNMPVAVARSVEVGGTTYNGYVRLMQGVDLRAFLSERAKTFYSTDTPQNMLQAFRGTFKTSEQLGIRRISGYR
jgi:hypothetical protein